MSGGEHSDPWGLNNVELLQEIATLVWTSTGNTQLSEQMARLRIGYELYQRFSGAREIEALRNQTILNISKWIQDNPKASKEEMAKEVGKQIVLFAQLVDKV
jgi:GAF domain-containing protein